jgi:hypothetical protein
LSLDLTAVTGQVIKMISGLRDSRTEQRRRLGFALETLGNEAIDLDDLKKKIRASRTTWLVADIVEGLNKSYPLPDIPTDFTVMAADGSHIDVDRHQTTRYYLINIGSVVLSYGNNPDAVLASSPHLYSDDKDLTITPLGGGREQPVEGTILGTKRSVEECRKLTSLTINTPPSNPAIALLDGTLILWGLEPYPEFVTSALLDDGLLKCLEAMKNLNNNRQLAMASYISFPRSTDVVNVLRVVICPNDIPDCDKQCPPGRERDCDDLAGLRDRDLFMERLGVGERSALFISPSKIVREHYGEHQVYFFYLKVGDEVARIEIPRWVAENRELLELTHGLVFDQTRRGHGYPVALAEAHEQAVVTGADRENFRQLVEATLIEEHLPSHASGKSLSKRTRWV